MYSCLERAEQPWTMGVALEHRHQLAHLPELARPQQVGPPVGAVDELQVAEVDVP